MQMPVSRTLGKLLEEMADRHPEREAVVFRDQRLTYQVLYEQVQRFAKGLLHLGVRRGDKVGVLMPNRPEWIIAEFASVSIGAVFVALNTWSRPRELKFLLNHSDATALVMTEHFRSHDYRGALMEICPELAHETGRGPLMSTEVPKLRTVIVHGERPEWAWSFDEICEMGTQVDPLEFERHLNAVSPEETANIIYTSGSTSFPKGVVLLHQGLIENGFHIGERQHITGEDRVWFSNPLFFSYGCVNALMATVTHGATFVLQEVFEPNEALQTLARERCTVYYATPNITHALYNHPARHLYDLTSLRTGTTLGPPATLRITMELGPKQICNVYGLTETYGNCCVADADDPPSVRMTSQGRPLPGNELRIVDVKTGKVMPIGEIGEIRVRGYVTPGYYKDEVLNAASFDEEGFFRTGDLGWLDEEGRIHWSGRIKEMIKTGGINVSPAEVEEVLTSHPAIRQAYVVGLPDPVQDEIVGAFVEVDGEQRVSMEDIIAHCKKHLSSYKVPRYIEFRQNHEFPLTATGKVRRAALLEQYIQSTSGIEKANLGHGGRGQ